MSINDIFLSNYFLYPLLIFILLGLLGYIGDTFKYSNKFSIKFKSAFGWIYFLIILFFIIMGWLETLLRYIKNFDYYSAFTEFILFLVILLPLALLLTYIFMIIIRPIAQYIHRKANED